MAKRTTKKKSASSDAAKIEKAIEKLDRELVKLSNERAKLYQSLDGAERIRMFDLDKESRSIEKLVDANRGPLDSQCVRAVLRELNSGSRALVALQRVAYLGPQYSYSYLAACERFGTSVEIVPVSTIKAVFEEVQDGQSDFGIVPIENSTDGRIVDTLGMFAQMPVRICGEVEFPIHHYLLGKGSRGDIREVYSKPQALSQCREWISHHLPSAKVVESSSTTAAAEAAGKSKVVAAIASREAGIQYGLDVLAANIEDNKNNVTRFAIIGNQSPSRTGHDKTSIMFELAHKPGALADAMSIFKRNRLNLTWIESFPMSGLKNEYLFFVELEGFESEMKVKRTLAALEKKTVRLVVLGSYAKSRAAD